MNWYAKDNCVYSNKGLVAECNSKENAEIIARINTKILNKIEYMDKFENYLMTVCDKEIKCDDPDIFIRWTERLDLDEWLQLSAAFYLQQPDCSKTIINYKTLDILKKIVGSIAYHIPQELFDEAQEIISQSEIN